MRFKAAMQFLELSRPNGFPRSEARRERQYRSSSVVKTTPPADTGALETCCRFGANNHFGCTVWVTLASVEDDRALSARKVGQSSDETVNDG